MGTIIASTYEVLEKLGSGGGGNVYLAQHLRLNKKVVLKADKRKLSTPPELLRREVDVLKNLRHTNIPQVYDFFVENDTVYTVMDYIEGESLDRPLKRGEKFSQAQVIKWAIQLLDALEYLHSPTHGDPPRGFIHSDIKPANIMRLPDDTICLIDFNIALALGEENIIGCSAGYSSPEHYGLDFSTNEPTSIITNGSRRYESSGATEYVPGNEVTEPAILPGKDTATAARVRTITPDVRSDIYSTGATLYHLLSGTRPARDAQQVAPLSEQEFSPLVVKIITKAMNPNPDLRYQSAADMRADFCNLRKNDPRTIRLRRGCRTAGVAMAVGLAAGAGITFVGMKRMQTTESWLKLAEYSRNALRQGNVEQAVSYAMQAFPEKKTILTPASVPEAENALASALGVYELADSFTSFGVVELPAAPLCVREAADGKTAACTYSTGAAVLDLETCRVKATLSADESALSEVEYIGNDAIIYAGAEGISAYSISEDKTLWQGQPATAIAVAADESCVAGVYRDEPYATLYDAKTGSEKGKIDFNGNRQAVPNNDIFANPNDSLLALNREGTLLAVSFEDGELALYDTQTGQCTELLESGSGYTHFEGGFSGKWFAVSATNEKEAVFACIDTQEMTQEASFTSRYSIGVQASENGIFVQTENLLVCLDPETGEQIPLVNTPENILTFTRGDTHTLIATKDSFSFYDVSADKTCEFDKTEEIDFLQLADGKALIAGSDAPSIRVMQYEQHADAEVLAYDTEYTHDEARVSADGKSVMLFDYNAFRIIDQASGRLVAEKKIPDAEQVYDQQFRREGEKSWLEVTYYDGTICCYDAANGEEISRERGQPPDKDLFMEYKTDDLRIEAPLHGTAAAYDRKTGKKVADLEKDAYLTYITQSGDYLVAQYITADGVQYGELLDRNCRVLAELPHLCDVIGETLYFDYPTGDIRCTRIYTIDALTEKARISGRNG